MGDLEPCSFGGCEGGHPAHDFAVEQCSVVTMAESGMELEAVLLERVLEGYPPSPFLSDRFGERLLSQWLWPEVEANRRGLRTTLARLRGLGL